MSFFYDDPADHPDAVTLNIAGKEVPFLLNKQAFERAGEEGVDLASFSDVDEEDVQGNLEALAALLYIGTLPFEGRDTPSMKDLDVVLTPRIASEVAPQAMAQFQGLADEEIEDVAGKE